MTHGWNPGSEDPRRDAVAPGDRTGDFGQPRHGWAQGYPDPDGQGQASPDAAGYGYRAARGRAGGARHRAGRRPPSQQQGHGQQGHIQQGHIQQGYGQQGHIQQGYGQQGHQPPGHQPPGVAFGYRPGEMAGGVFAQPDVITYGYPPVDSPNDYDSPPPGTSRGAAVFDTPSGPRTTPSEPRPDDAEFLLGHVPASSPRPARIQRTPRSSARGRRGRLSVVIGVPLLVVLIGAAAVAAAAAGWLGRPARHAHAPRPAHTLATPKQIGRYTRDPQAERQLGLSHGEQYLTQIDPGHVSGIVAAVYDTGGPASSPNRVAVIAGRLGNSRQSGVVKSFVQQESAEGNLPVMIPAGPLGGQAACAGKGSSGICVWVDRDTVGVLVSATTNATSLSRLMLRIRPAIEIATARG